MENQIKEIINDDEIIKVKLAIADIDGVLRGKYIHKDKFKSVIESHFGFCDVVFGWDSGDICYDNATLTGWHTGYPDAQAKIDPATLRRVPWDQGVPFFLGYFENETGEKLAACPRALLMKIRDQAHQDGFRPFFAQEFEWFNFNEESQTLNGKEFKSPEPLTPGMFGYSLLRASMNSSYFNDLFDLLSEFQIPLEGLHTETGPGVYEAAIMYSDVLEAADRAVLFKTAVKEIGHRHGIMPTFMAKWSDDYPGCSGHLHQSIQDENGKNLFYDEKSKMSSFMESYIAGLLHCLPHVLPMYAPNINSFKRLVEGAWAPTTLTWGIDNRTTAVRALPGKSSSTRIELRVPGSDMNPYLAMAASLASGLYGVKQNLKLETPPVKGNGYKVTEHGVLPSSLDEAVALMKSSELANSFFGEDFVDHFCKTREWESRQYKNSITDWELKRYFEII